MLRFIDLPAAVSPALVEQIPGRAAARAQVLPCGVDMERFRPLDAHEARAELGLDPSRPFALFAADPARPEKRHELAAEVAAAAGVELRTLGGVEPARVPLWVNAASAVVVPSAREGFGLAVLEALACDVPVLATPVGIHAEALAGVEGTLCAPFRARQLARGARAAGGRGRAPCRRAGGRRALVGHGDGRARAPAWLDALARTR